MRRHEQNRHGKGKSFVSPPPLGWAVLTASFAINILSLALPLVVLQVFDRVIPFGAYETLTVLFWGLCATVALDFAFKWARIMLLGHAGEVFERDLSRKVLDHTLQAESQDFEECGLGVHYDRMGAVTQLRDYYAGQGRLLAVDLPFIGIFIALIGIIGGWLVLVPLSCLALILGFRMVLKSMQGPALQKRKTLDGRRYSFLIEFLTQITTVKAQTMEPQMLRRYEMLQKQSVAASGRLIRISGLSQSFGAIFSQGAVAAMGIFGGYLVIVGKIGMAELAACMLLNGRTVQPLLKMLGFWVQAENVSTARQKLDELSEVRQRPKARKPPTIRTGVLEMTNIALKLRGSDRHVFKGINFNLNPGQVIAVYGSDGHDPANLFRLIMGEQRATTGNIFWDGVETHGLDDSTGIGFADGRPVLFDGTILENISRFGGVKDIETALSTSTELGLEELVHRMPLGYGTRIGKGGTQHISAGVAQLINLTRVLSSAPRLLVLNDPGAGLDHGMTEKLAGYIRSHRDALSVLLASRDPVLFDLVDVVVRLSPAMDAGDVGWQDNTPILPLADNRRIA